MFIASYLDLIEKYKKYGITDNTFLKEKENLLNNMIIPWIVKITNKDVDLSLENIIEIYSKYYKNESYYEEKLKIIKGLLLKLNY